MGRLRRAAKRIGGKAQDVATNIGGKAQEIAKDAGGAVQDNISKILPYAAPFAAPFTWAYGAAQRAFNNRGPGGTGPGGTGGMDDAGGMPQFNNPAEFPQPSNTLAAKGLRPPSGKSIDRVGGGRIAALQQMSGGGAQAAMPPLSIRGFNPWGPLAR